MADTADSVNTLGPAKNAARQDGECLMLCCQRVWTSASQLDPMPRQGPGSGVHQMVVTVPSLQGSTPDLKAFSKPECDTNALSSCPVENVVNVYDNSIRYTDHFTGPRPWVTAQDPAKPV